MTVTTQYWSEKTDKWFGFLFILYALVAPLSISATYVALGLITALGIILLYRKGGNPLRPHLNLIIPFCLIYLWAAMTALMAGSFSLESVFRGIKELSPIILFPLFIQTTSINKEKVIWSLLISASLVCLLGIIQSAVPTIVYPLRRQLWDGAFMGTFHNRLFAGGFISIISIQIFSMILFWETKIYKKVILWLFFILNIVALLLTMGRSYYISTVIVLLFLMFLKDWKWFTSGSIVSAIIIVTLISFPNPVNTRIKSIIDSNDISRNARISIWKISFDLIKENPVTGIGKGNWEKHVRERYSNLTDDGLYAHPHNIWLYILAETGIIGLLFFLLFWGTVIRHLLWTAGSIDKNSFTYALNIGVASSIGNLFIAGFFESMITTLVILLLHSFLIGISLSAEVDTVK